jgi:hypothetical protein
MKRSIRVFLAALLVATPLLAGCADTTGPSAPETTLTAQPQAGLLDGLLGVVGGLLTGVLNILSGPDANGSETSAWIGSGGGTIKTAAYTLTVPKGAVTSNTLFELEPANDGTYKVQLTATRNGLLGTINVGAQGFRKPVLFTVSYAKATGVTDARKLAIVYLRSDGKFELTATSVNTKAKTVTSSLPHFSKYALVQN